MTVARSPGIRLLGVLLLALSLVVASRGVLSGGVRRWALLLLALLLLGGAAALLPWDSAVLLALDALTVLALAGGVAAAHAAFRVSVPLDPVPAPARPVLFWNPRSGGGSALRHHLAHEARTRGIEPVELRPGDDLRTLVAEAVAAGADALAAAGGDGTQAVVAEMAAERDLPFACIPAGTRNHFALDLGVDRTDVVGALDAFVDGGERRIDLPQVNGRTFVNNVSLGLYAEAVATRGYREAKLRTMLATAGRAQDFDLEWTGPHGNDHRGGIAVLVSNNRYRVGVVDGGTRPRIDEGLLGITVLGSPASSAWRPGPCSGRGGNGRRPRSRSGRTGRSPRASTASPCCSTRRCASRSERASCGCASPARTRAHRRRRRRPSAWSTWLARWRTWPRAVSRRRSAPARIGRARAERQRRRLDPRGVERMERLEGALQAGVHLEDRATLVRRRVQPRRGHRGVVAGDEIGALVRAVMRPPPGARTPPAGRDRASPCAAGRRRRHAAPSPRRTGARRSAGPSAARRR